MCGMIKNDMSTDADRNSEAGAGSMTAVLVSLMGNKKC